MNRDSRIFRYIELPKRSDHVKTMVNKTRTESSGVEVNHLRDAFARFSFPTRRFILMKSESFVDDLAPGWRAVKQQAERGKRKNSTDGQRQDDLTHLNLELLLNRSRCRASSDCFPSNKNIFDLVLREHKKKY